MKVKLDDGVVIEIFDVVMGKKGELQKGGAGRTKCNMTSLQ